MPTCLKSKTRSESRPQYGRPLLGIRQTLAARLIGTLCLVASVLASQVGCRGMLAENMKPPGTIWEQRNRAVQFDPYPIDHMGPPIVGGRPRDYDRPLAEATSNQLVPKTSRW